MTIDMTIECYSSTHLKWAFSLGIPMLIFWVIGAPVLVLVILIRNRNNLQDEYMKKYFLMLYQGLKPKAFYWEFVNTLRKIVMPLFSVLLARAESFYSVMVAIILLVFLFRIQQNLHPYKLEENNQIEMLAIITGMITLFGAIVFINTVGGTRVKNVEFLQIFSLIVIFFINVYFVLRWFHLFLYSFSSKNSVLELTRKILGYSLMMNKDSELATESKYVTTKEKSVKKKSIGK